MPRIYRVLALLLCMAASCGCLCAQADQTITLRMLDARTGKLIETSYFLVRINHEETVHANWVLQNQNGTGKLTCTAVDDTKAERWVTYNAGGSVKGVQNFQFTTPQEQA